MTSNTIGAAVATRDETKALSPRGLVTAHEKDFEAILPSHVNAKVWVMQVVGALKRSPMDKQIPGLTVLEVAARNNPQAFINTLRVAAGYGLMPGTPEFYLTPRPVKGRMEILGIVGYQGYIELIYRAGAVESVHVEVVRRNESFMYRKGRDEVPLHEVDWTVTSGKRGDLWLVYAYAKLRGGGHSQVIVMDEDDIARVREKSASYAADLKYNSKSSPWNTDPEAMWLKSAVRQLQKWVPTSSEFITSQLRAVEAAGQPSVADSLPTIAHPGNLPDEVADGHEVWADDGEVVDAEVVPSPAPAGPPLIDPAGPQMRRIQTLFGKLGVTDEPDKYIFAETHAGHPVASLEELTVPQADLLIADLVAREKAVNATAR